MHPVPERPPLKCLLAAAAVLVVLLIGGACGDDSGESGTGHNDQDVSFAKDMVPHHQQAVTMSDLATANTTNPQILDLANRIKSSQTAEISLMQGWLAAWGEEATDHSGHDMSESMKGMVSDGDMGQLETTRGGDFDRLFLRHMTAHHEGALEMARAELDKGRFAPAKDLARKIVTSQEGEIAEMRRLLSAPRSVTP